MCAHTLFAGEVDGGELVGGKRGPGAMQRKEKPRPHVAAVCILIEEEEGPGALEEVESRGYLETAAPLCHTKHVINHCKRSPPARAKESACKCFVLDDTSGVRSSKGTTYGNQRNSLKKEKAGSEEHKHTRPSDAPRQTR